LQPAILRHLRANPVPFNREPLIFGTTKAHAPKLRGNNLQEAVASAGIQSEVPKPQCGFTYGKFRRGAIMYGFVY